MRGQHHKIAYILSILNVILNFEIIQADTCYFYPKNSGNKTYTTNCKTCCNNEVDNATDACCEANSLFILAIPFALSLLFTIISFGFMAFCVYCFRTKKKQNTVEDSNSSTSPTTDTSNLNENMSSTNIFTTLPNYYQASKMNVQQDVLPDILPTYFKLFSNATNNTNNSSDSII